MTNLPIITLDQLAQIAPESYDPAAVNLGLDSVDVDERPTLSRQGKPTNEVVLQIVTDLGSVGSLTMDAKQYAGLSDYDLARLLVVKRDELDRARLMSMVK